MLHFGTQFQHRLVWGSRILGGNMPQWFNGERGQSITPWLDQPGQRTGGIGMYRTATGQPLRLSPNGTYAFDTYSTGNLYPSGEYSFAIVVSIALVEGFTVNDAAVVGGIITVSIADGVGVTSQDTPYKSAVLAITEGLDFVDQVSLNVIMEVLISDGITLIDDAAPGGNLLSYVVNSTTYAVTKYDGFNFNSYARLGTKYYGMSENGLYELSGDDDAGSQINAHFTLGKQDFGTDAFKRISSVYVGATVTGGLILKTITDSGATYYYELEMRGADSMQNNRFVVGRGLCSRYWKFEIRNVDGSDFNFDSISFHPVKLNRHIGGAV